MRVPETIKDEKNLFINECETTSHTSKQEQDNKSSPSTKHLYTEIVKAIGNNKFKEDKTLFKRASWSPAGHQECGLPPTGKRIDGDHSTGNKNSNRVRMRSKPTRNYQLQQPNQIPLIRPVSFNERYERFSSNQPLNRNGNLSNQRREQTLSPSTDTLLQITRHASPSIDNSDFISDTSNTSSITTLPSQKINPIYSSTKTRPLLNAYQQKDSDYKLLSPVLNTNTVSLSSPISSSASFTCQKGHEESSPSSPVGSSLNQYTEFTSQTPSIDSSRDDSCHPTTTTTRSTMTMSISPNRHHNQTHSSMTNNIDGLKQERHQTESTIVSGGCLKSNKKSNNRTKKSVHFDWNLPTEIQSIYNNYQPSVIVTSSSLSIDDNDKQKKKNDCETVKEKERTETTRRTIMTTTTPLTTHTIHRSFSLSPSPPSKEENNSSNRRHRQVKKENVDDTTSRRVTFNYNISPTKKSNGMNNFNGSENLTHQMPLNTLLVKTASFNSQPSTKKVPITTGFLNFINRSNSNNHKSSSSIQRKSKQCGNKRLSADIDSLSKEDIDKVTTNRQKELQSTIDNSNTDSSNPQRTNRSSISMSTITLKSNESDSLNNGLLFKPIESIKKEAFYLSPPKSNDESLIGKTMQTSTLIISTPPQYHYYLYPPTISKKNSTKNISMNSISTNSSSSSSYDLDDDTLSYSTYSTNNQNKIQQLKPVILSDSVQNFWPPPPSPSILNNDPEQTIMASTVEQNKQSQSNIQQNTYHSSSYNDDSLSMRNILPPTTSLMLSNKEEEVRSYSEQSSFSNGCLRIASDSSLEDSQASYIERLREKSRSINRPVAMNVNNYSLSRSRSKDNLNNGGENFNLTNRNILRPKSAGQIRAQALLSPVRQEISNDFQSKRQFFENRIYTDYTPTSTNNRIYINPPINHQQRHVTKQPPPPQPESLIRTTKYFDSLSSQVSFPPTIYRKPVRIVKAVQRSAPSPTINDIQSSFPLKMNFEKNYLNEINLSSQYIRNLFPIPDCLKRNRSRQNSDNNDIRTIPNDNIQQTEDLLLNVRKRLEILKDNQRIINDEIEINTILGAKLMKIIESKAELNEIEKLKLHINEIETITSVLLKLSCRLAKVENDLLTITDDNAHTKANLLEQREKIQQKHDEAKSLKDGIDRRSRLVTKILRKYLSDEQFDDYEHFIRMKSTLLMDGKDIEENLTFLQKFLNPSHFENSSSNHADNIQTNYHKQISTTA